MEYQNAAFAPPPPYSGEIQKLPPSLPPHMSQGYPNQGFSNLPIVGDEYPQEKVGLQPAAASGPYQGAPGTAPQQPYQLGAGNPNQLVYPPGMPTEKQQMIQQMMSQYQQPTVTPPTDGQVLGAFPPPPLAPMAAQGPRPPESKDEKKTGKVQRFLGDTLIGRFARASVQTATSTLKMPAALSPWGDNNPVTLPNVRYRDAVLFTTFAVVGAPLIEAADGAVSDLFGADSFVSDVVSSGAGAVTGSTLLKYGIFQLVEQAIDKGILEHMLPEEQKLIVTTGLKSVQVAIKHKLMGVDADIRYWGVYPATDTVRCSKGESFP